jgi:type IV secretion system protein VirB10
MRPPKKQTIPTQEEVDLATKKGENSDDELESTTESISDKPASSSINSFIPKLRATAAKRSIKIIGSLMGASIVIYKMFLSNADISPTQDEIDQGVIAVKQVPKTSKDFANQDIPLGNKQLGDIAKKEPPKITEKTPYIAALPTPKEIKLDAPELPPLPDLNIDHNNTDFKPPTLGNIAKKTIKTPTSAGQENPDGTITPNPTQPFNPQNVTSNGIPIVNSADLSLEQKRQLTMFVMAGSGPVANPDTSKKTDKNDIIILDGSALSVKKISENVTAEMVTSLDTTLIQGKIMNAVLETAVNSQLPGTVRGIITEDVYGEMGNKVLIARGSRIYGAYSTAVTRGQSRISISWTRLIRPDGISISINGQATDQFGRAGLEGDVDNRFGDTFTNTLLSTMIPIAAAVALDKVAGTSASQSQTINPSGTFTTSNINPVSVAAQSAIQTMQKFTDQMTAGASDLKPIVTLPQGTKIKVMVAQDITIPPFRKSKLS